MSFVFGWFKKKMNMEKVKKAAFAFFLAMFWKGFFHNPLPHNASFWCNKDIWYLFSILNSLSNVVCNFFNLDHSKILSSGSELSIVQINEFCLWIGKKKKIWKKWKGCLPAFALCLAMFWKGFLINPLPGDKFKTLPNWKSLQTTISNLMKMTESYPNG